MANEAGLAKFVLGLGAVVLGTSFISSTITGVSCYYAGKKQRYDDAKPKIVCLQNISVDKKRTTNDYCRELQRRKIWLS